MADFDSSMEIESGLPQLAIGSRRLQRKERMLFAHHDFEQARDTPPWNRKCMTNKDLKRQKSGNSTSSEKSSNATHTRHSCVTTIPDYSISLDNDTVSSTPPPPPPPSQKEIYSGSYVASCQTSLSNAPLSNLSNISTMETANATSDQSASTAEKAETEPHPSPRIHMNSPREQNPRQSLPLHFGPMERFLAQEDDLIDPNPARVAEERTKLRLLRINVFRLRAELHKKRKELTEKESKKNSADQAFMKFVREHVSALSSPSSSVASASASQLPALQAHYSAMQTARDDYGPSEYDCNKLEDFLDHTEFELEKLEGRLYKPIPSQTDGADTVLALASISQTPPSASQSFMGLSSEPTEDYHPLHAEFLSRLGDLDLAMERFHNIRQERESLLSDQETRTRLGIPFNDDLKIFLDQFPAREAALKDEIDDLKETIEKLKLDCLKEGIHVEESSNGSIQGGARSENENSNEDTTGDDVVREIQGPSSDHNHSMFPLLFPKSDKDKADLGVLNIEFDESNKSDRINRWLLYKLRTSPLEIDLFAQIFLSLVNILDFRQWRTDIRQWQQDAMSFWGHDEANKPPESFNAARTRNSSSKTSIIQHKPINNIVSTPKHTLHNPRIVHKAKSAPASIDFGRIVLDRPESVQIVGF
jgi:hypothetical protein